MAADPNCQTAYDAAQKAAKTAAKDLGVKTSPLVKELSSTKIPDAGDPNVLREAFIEKMKQVEEAAKALGAAAS
jgi:hypothetical protein